MQVVRKSIFLFAILFIGVTVFSLSVGQILPYEFAESKMMHTFYDVIMQGLPIAILLTLFRTFKKRNTKFKNWAILILTVLASVISFFIMVSLLFRIGFGSWTTLSILYKNNNDNRVVKEQIFDVGALGYGGRRIVEIKPVLKFWVLPTEVDTTSLDKTKWTFVNEGGDIKFP